MVFWSKSRKCGGQSSAGGYIVVGRETPREHRIQSKPRNCCTTIATTANEANYWKHIGRDEGPSTRRHRTSTCGYIVRTASLGRHGNAMYLPTPSHLNEATTVYTPANDGEPSRAEPPFHGGTQITNQRRSVGLPTPPPTLSPIPVICTQIKEATVLSYTTVHYQYLCFV